MISYSYKLCTLLSLLCALYVANVKTSAIQSRIISGAAAKEGQFPWQVILKLDKYDNLKCGGSIIANNWVLTAAHCIYKLKSILLIFGTIHLGNDVNNMTSNEFFIHPQYEPPSVNNDIALIKLPKPLIFTNTIQPIALVPLSQASNSFVGSIATITGFGLTDDEYLDPSDILLWAQVKIIDINSCRSIYPNEEINDTNICALGDDNTNMSTCSGDSGGPLILTMNKIPVQIGINSFVATEMCTDGYPSGYIRLTSYLHYISEVTGLSLK